MRDRASVSAFERDGEEDFSNWGWGACGWGGRGRGVKLGQSRKKGKVFFSGEKEGKS